MENKLLPVELFIYGEEEEWDSISIELLLKKYQKLFKFLYTKYSASGYHTADIRGFEDIEKRKETLNLAETYKMLKDHGINSRIIPKSNLSSLMQAINKYFNGWGDLAPLNYEHFVEFFFQIAYFIYTKPPFDLSHKPPADCLKAIID